jgi:hypothetical protein
MFCEIIKGEKMDNIIEFPKKTERDWLEIEKVIKDYLKKIPELSEEDINYINERMKKFHSEVMDKEFNLKFKTPNNMKKSEADKIMKYAIESFEKEIHDYIGQILSERLNLEIRMYLNNYTFEN